MEGKDDHVEKHRQHDKTQAPAQEVLHKHHLHVVCEEQKTELAVAQEEEEELAKEAELAL